MSIRQVYDTTALLSISLIKKLDILRKLGIDVFVPQINAKELVIEDVDAIGGLVGISKIRQKSFKRVSNKKRAGTERFI